MQTRLEILSFQLLLALSLLSGIIFSFYFGLPASAGVSTLLAAAALGYYFKAFGADWRAVFLVLLFYALSWFFFFVRFFPFAFSLSQLPLLVASILGVIVVFRLFVYNREGEGKIVGKSGQYLLVEVEQGVWHSLSGVHAVAGEGHFSTGERVRLQFSSGLLSQPKVSRVGKLRSAANYGGGLA